MPRTYNLHVHANANWNCIVKGEEHEQQIVSDSMYKHNDHNLKFCILRSIVLPIQKVCI